MSIYRIYAVLLRFVYGMRHSLDKAVDIFYWPFTDLVLWGLTSLYFTSLAPDLPPVITPIVAGIILYVLVHRGQQEISVGVLDELWNRNLVNIFVSPLSLYEWMSGLFLVGIFKGLISFFFAMIVAFLLYSVSITFFGFYLVPFVLLLMMTGWWMGLLIASAIMRFGTKVQSLAWTLVWVISPFSAIYFPVTILPGWAQAVSRLIPSSYVFEASRGYIATGTVNAEQLAISFGLNVLYLIIAVAVFQASFKVVLSRGLVKLN